MQFRMMIIQASWGKNAKSLAKMYLQENVIQKHAYQEKHTSILFNLVEIGKQLDKCDEKEKKELNKIDLDRFVDAKPAVIKLF